MTNLYDIKKIHESLFLIKTTEEVDLLKKYLMQCFDHKDTFFLVDISDQPNIYQNPIDNNISSWLNNI
jgi:hypothetical protein